MLRPLLAATFLLTGCFTEKPSTTTTTTTSTSTTTYVCDSVGTGGTPCLKATSTTTTVAKSTDSVGTGGTP